MCIHAFFVKATSLRRSKKGVLRVCWQCLAPGGVGGGAGADVQGEARSGVDSGAEGGAEAAKTGVEGGVTRLRLCSGCRRARYCGRECQAADWERHRAWCTATTAARAARAVPVNHISEVD